jgi:hypothetical protein
MEVSEKNPSRLKTVHMHHAYARRTCHAQGVRLGKIISPLLHKAQPTFQPGLSTPALLCPEFPRRTLIGSSVSKGNSAPRHWLSLICWREIPEKRIIKLVVGASSLLEALREGQPRREAGERNATGLHNRRRPGYRTERARALIKSPLAKRRRGGCILILCILVLAKNSLSSTD